MPQPVFRVASTGTFNGASFNVNYPAGTTTGDLVLIFVNAQDSGTTFNAPTGFSTDYGNDAIIRKKVATPSYTSTSPQFYGYNFAPFYNYTVYPGAGLYPSPPYPLPNPATQSAVVNGTLTAFTPTGPLTSPIFHPTTYYGFNVIPNNIDTSTELQAGGTLVSTHPVLRVYDPFDAAGVLTAYYRANIGSNEQYGAPQGYATFTNPAGTSAYGQYAVIVIAAGTYDPLQPIDGYNAAFNDGPQSVLGGTAGPTQITPFNFNTLFVPHQNDLVFYAVSSGNRGTVPGFSGLNYMYSGAPGEPVNSQPILTTDGYMLVGQGSTSGAVAGICGYAQHIPAIELVVQVAVRGNDSAGAQVAQFYISAAYSTDAQFHVAQQAIEVAALPVSNAMLVQQAVEVLHAVGVVQYHTTDTYSVNRYTVGGGNPAAIPPIPPTTTDAYLVHSYTVGGGDPGASPPNPGTTEALVKAASGLSYVAHAGSGNLSAPGVLPTPPHTIDSYSVWSFVVGGTDQRPGHPTNNTPSTTDALLYQTAGYSYIATTGFSTPQLLKAPYQTTNALLYAEAGVSYVAHAGSGNLSAPGVLPAPKHTIDCFLHYTSGISEDPATGLVIPDVYHTTDIIAKGSNYRQHDLDALLLAIYTQQHDTSALIYHPWRLPHTTSAVLRATRDISHSTDAKIGTSNFISHTADAHVVQYNILQRMTTDTSIIGRPIVKHWTDARLKQSVIIEHALDTYIMHTGRPAHSIDATTWGTMSVLHTADALIYAANVHSHTTDTSTAPFQLRRHTTDAMVRRTTVLVHTITANLIQPVLPGVIPSYRFTYRDDYGQTYTSIYKITGTAPYDILDITTIIEQPYVWGANDAGYVQARNLYRRGIITTQRQVLQGQDNGYIIIVDELQPDHYQWIDNILTSFNCYDVPVDPFKYHLSASINDTVDLPATQGVRFTDLGDMAVIWGQIAQDGTVSIPTTDVVVNPNGTINDFPTLMEWMDVWSEPRVTVPWRVYMGTSLRTVLIPSNFAELFPVQLFYNALVTYQFAGGGYKYICFPTSFPAPVAFLDPLHKIAGQHANVVMADTSDNPAYHNLENDYSYAVLTMTLPGGLSTDYRIYRTKYQIGGPLTIQLSG